MVELDRPASRSASRPATVVAAAQVEALVAIAEDAEGSGSASISISRFQGDCSAISRRTRRVGDVEQVVEPAGGAGPRSQSASAIRSIISPPFGCGSPRCHRSAPRAPRRSSRHRAEGSTTSRRQRAGRRSTRRRAPGWLLALEVVESSHLGGEAANRLCRCPPARRRARRPALGKRSRRTTCARRPAVVLEEAAATPAWRSRRRSQPACRRRRWRLALPSARGAAPHRSGAPLRCSRARARRRPAPSCAAARAGWSGAGTLDVDELVGRTPVALQCAPGRARGAGGGRAACGHRRSPRPGARAPGGDPRDARAYAKPAPGGAPAPRGGGRFSAPAGRRGR